MARRRSPYHGPTDLRDRRVTVYRGRGVKVDFQLNRSGMRKLALGDELRDACRSVIVDRALPYAVRASPRARVDDGDGNLPYVASWRVAAGTTVLVGMRRVAVKLINIAPHAAAVEFVNPETGRGHGYRVLGGTLAHLDGQSVVAVKKARKQGAWKAEAHPRGAGGRFAPKPKDGSPSSGAGQQAAAQEAESALTNAVYEAARRRRAGR